MLVLNANKTKMVRLARAMGYNPPRNARFVKAFRSRTWWLEWESNTGFYSATLSAAAGRAFFGMRYQEYDSDSPEKWTAETLAIEELKKFDLVEEVPPKEAAPVRNNTPEWEPEL